MSYFGCKQGLKWRFNHANIVLSALKMIALRWNDATRLTWIHSLLPSPFYVDMETFQKHWKKNMINSWKNSETDDYVAIDLKKLRIEFHFRLSHAEVMLIIQLFIVNGVCKYFIFSDHPFGCVWRVKATTKRRVKKCVWNKK